LSPYPLAPLRQNSSSLRWRIGAESETACLWLLADYVRVADNNGQLELLWRQAVSEVSAVSS
jgi:hypothetical protein